MLRAAIGRGARIRRWSLVSTLDELGGVAVRKSAGGSELRVFILEHPNTEEICMIKVNGLIFSLKKP